MIRDIHAHSLKTSSSLSSYYMPNAPTPLAVIAALNRAGVSFVLVGAHGLGGWMNKPRATEDVDVIVASKHQKKAVTVLVADFPHLQPEDHEAVIRLRDPETSKVAIDVMKPNQTLHREIFKHTKSVTASGQEYRIPSLEMALALKFAPMISLSRAEIDKYQDAHDFGRMVVSNPEIDLAKLEQLGELVYPGGGAEILEKVRQVRAGERLTL